MVVSIAQAQVFFLAFTRVMAIIIQVPMLGGQLIPNQVRIGLGFLLALVLIPWQPLSAETPAIPTLTFGVAVIRELVIGLLAGFAALITFSVFTMAGELIGLSSGFGSARVFNPSIGESGSAMDQLFIMACLLVFLIINGHHAFILTLQRTFTLLPLNQPLPEFNIERFLPVTIQLFTIGVQLALPVISAILLTDLTMALLARVSPQVQVFFLGLPLKVAVGFIALALTIAILMPTIRQIYYDLGPRMLHFLGA